MRRRTGRAAGRREGYSPARFMQKNFEGRTGMNKQNQMEVLLECQKKYGQRRSDSLEAWVLRKRAINTAVMVVFSITGIDFSDFEPALYFRL